MLSKSREKCYGAQVNMWLRLLQAKKRNEIRDGKLWEITRVWGMDVKRVEKEPPKADPFKRPEGGDVKAVRVHVLAGENNVTNITKQSDVV
jgi:hypothetical protein